MTKKIMPLNEVLNILYNLFPDAKGELIHNNVFELLIAVILSAQTTDQAVNAITPKLFRDYPNPKTLAQAHSEIIQDYIKTIGLYKNKTKFIIQTSQKLIETFNGQVPKTRDELMSLPGVGRKTANVVLAQGFNIPAIGVDTHVERVTKRLGYAKPDDSPLTVEKNLMKLIPEKDWARAHLALLLFGRYYSRAKSTKPIYEILLELKKTNPFT